MRGMTGIEATDESKGRKAASDRVLTVGLIGASTIADHNHLPVLGALQNLAPDWV